MSSHKRLFIGLSPGQDTRQRLLLCQQTLLAQDSRLRAAKLIPAANLHLTLEFLGEVEACSIDALETALACLAQPDFELQLESLGYFAKARILWLGPTEAPAALQALVMAVQAAVAAALPEHEVDSQQHIPHISLFRSAPVSAPARLEVAIRWRPECFALFESVNTDSGVRYQMLREFRLRAG